MHNVVYLESISVVCVVLHYVWHGLTVLTVELIIIMFHRATFHTEINTNKHAMSNQDKLNSHCGSFTLRESVCESELFLWPLSFLNVNIKLGSLWNHLESTSLSFSHQYKRTLNRQSIMTRWDGPKTGCHFLNKISCVGFSLETGYFFLWFMISLPRHPYDQWQLIARLSLESTRIWGCLVDDIIESDDATLSLRGTLQATRATHTALRPPLGFPSIIPVL